MADSVVASQAAEGVAKAAVGVASMVGGGALSPAAVTQKGGKRHGRRGGKMTQKAKKAAGLLRKAAAALKKGGETAAADKVEDAADKVEQPAPVLETPASGGGRGKGNPGRPRRVGRPSKSGGRR